jgi:transcriptional antiterminator NusG
MIVTDDTCDIVRNNRGCTGLIGPASAPTPLAEEDVEKTFGIDVSTPIVDVNFKVGDNVRITGTAMDGVIGVVQNINIEDRTVDILVSMLGRETMATLPLSQVAEVD